MSDFLKDIIKQTGNEYAAIVAEGIETETQFKKLRELGCHFGQGFYMSKPLPLRELLPKIKKKSNLAIK